MNNDQDMKKMLALFESAPLTETQDHDGIAVLPVPPSATLHFIPLSIEELEMMEVDDQAFAMLWVSHEDGFDQEGIVVTSRDLHSIRQDIAAMRRNKDY